MPVILHSHELILVLLLLVRDLILQCADPVAEIRILKPQLPKNVIKLQLLRDQVVLTQAKIGVEDLNLRREVVVLVEKLADLAVLVDELVLRTDDLLLHLASVVPFLVEFSLVRAAELIILVHFVLQQPLNVVEVRGVEHVGVALVLQYVH